MPQPDPVPSPRHSLMRRFWRIFRLLALIYLQSAGGPVPIHMVIATIAGVGFSVLLGTALMGLVYFSNNSGHDDTIGRGDDVND